MLRSHFQIEISRADLRDLNIIGWAVLAGLLLIVGQRSLQINQERDFVYFYSVGLILNHNPPSDLYDYGLQKEVFAQVQPLGRSGSYGPSPYPPYVAMFFRPLARLEFMKAYRIWTAVTLVLYVAGLSLLIFHFFPKDRLKQSSLFCFALCFWPFMARTLLNGQLAAVGFFAMALALFLEDSGRPYASGFALATCLYKPTLLLLILPMLLVIRRFKTLAGFVLGGTALVALTTWVEGFAIWPAFVRMSSHVPGFRPFLQFDDYVDFGSFGSMIAHGARLARIVVAYVAAAACVYLAGAWWRARRWALDKPATLLWATTLTWTLLLNVYTPIYDSILVVISVIVTVAAMGGSDCSTLMVLCFFLLVLAPITKGLAVLTGWQVLTLVLFAFGTVQLRLLRSQGCGREYSGQRQ